MEVKAVIKILKRLPWDNDRLKSLQTMTETLTLTSADFPSIMKVFTFDESRIKAIDILSRKNNLQLFDLPIVLKILDHDESKLELLNKFKIDDGTVLLTSLKLLSNDDNKVKLVKKYVGTITVNQCVTALNQIMLPDKKGLAATYLLQRVVNNDNSLQSLDNFSDIFVSYEYFERLSSDIGFSTENIQIVKARFEETVILENPKGSYNLNIQCAGDTLIVDGSNYPMPIGARYRIGDTLIVRKGDGRHFIIKYPSKN